MRALGLGVLMVACHVAGCGDESSSVVGPSNGGSAGSELDGSAGLSGGSGGSGAVWPGGSAGLDAGAAGGAAGDAGGSGGASGAGAVGGAGGTGSCPSADAGTPVQCGTGGPCQFPQGVPDPGFIASACEYQDTDKTVDSAVNAVMAKLTGCGVGSDCPITVVGGANTAEVCQSWFAAVTAELRTQGYCAGQHEVGFTDEIAVSNTCCEGKWYGYHICNYGGAKVVWNPGARRGWWMIAPTYCAP